MRGRNHPAFVLFALAGCAEENRTVVLWPEVAADSLSFIVIFDETGRQVVGPVAGDAPSQNVSVSSEATSVFINFDRS